MNEENPDYLLGRISILEEREKYLDDWLTNLDEAQEVASEVIAIRDQTTWALDALRNRPEEASEIILNLSDDQLEEENQFIIDRYPSKP